MSVGRSVVRMKIVFGRCMRSRRAYRVRAKWKRWAGGARRGPRVLVMRRRGGGPFLEKKKAGCQLPSPSGNGTPPEQDKGTYGSKDAAKREAQGLAVGKLLLMVVLFRRGGVVCLRGAAFDLNRLKKTVSTTA